MRRFHAQWESAVSASVLGECINPECTMDHVVTMQTDEQARLARLLELDTWARVASADEPALGRADVVR